MISLADKYGISIIARNGDTTGNRQQATDNQQTDRQQPAVSSQPRLRVGVIGVGYLGKFHAEKYARMNDVELAGIVDSDKSQAENVAGKLSAKAYPNYQDLLGKVDAVSIVVPTPAHFSISKFFLENDVDVLIEKPMTTTLKEADELIRIAESRGCIVQVGHLERFNPAVVALRDIVKKPMFIESHRLSVYKGRGTDVSVVLDLMIHDIDIILNFVKSEIKNIHSSGIPVISGHVDIANARLEFANGCVANVTASRISTKNERKIRLFQKDTYVSVDFANHDITVIQMRETGENAETELIPGMDIKRMNFEKGDALDDELKSFVRSVINREASEVTGQMGRDALKIALSVMDQICDRLQQAKDKGHSSFG
ncbi:MAG: Gfo/Idh/MocA family oxidoreductase [Desulfobacteraceae bacterium]|nr:Gfo/Idh/MocA family oxidoreductase [Desulfobacteraceae bacterium]